MTRLNLDFPVSLRKFLILDKAGINGEKNKEGAQVIPKKRFVVYREDNANIFGVVSDRFKLIHHKEVRTSVENEMKRFENPPEMVSESLSKGGSIYYAHYEFKKAYAVSTILNKEQKPDNVKLQIIMSNGMAGNRPLSFELGALRLVCSNGMRAWRSEFAVRRLHTTSLKYKDLTHQLSNAVGRFEKEILPFWQSLCNLKIARETAIKMLHEQFTMPEKYKKMAEDSYDLKPKQVTAWDLYNSVTWAITHRIKSYERQRHFLNDADRSIRILAKQI